jgi:hypothetical protein
VKHIRCFAQRRDRRQSITASVEDDHHLPGTIRRFTSYLIRELSPCQRFRIDLIFNALQGRKMPPVLGHYLAHIDVLQRLQIVGSVECWLGRRGEHDRHPVVVYERPQHIRRRFKQLRR